MSHAPSPTRAWQLRPRLRPRTARLLEVAVRGQRIHRQLLPAVVNLQSGGVCAPRFVCPRVAEALENLYIGDG